MVDELIFKEDEVWFDVGIIKGTTCMVTHYFTSSLNSLENNYVSYPFEDLIWTNEH